VDRFDRYILILGILVLIMLAVAYYFLLFSPLRQEYLDRFDERVQKEQQLAGLEQSVAELENARRNAPEIERQILEYSKRIPEQDEIPTLVVQVEQVAEGAGVTQLLITPEAPAPPPGGGDFSAIPLTMSFEGTYENMTDFLLRVRNLSRLVTINELTYCRKPLLLEGVEGCPVEGSEEGGEAAAEGGEETTAELGTEDLLEVQVVAETYVQPAGGGVPTTAAPAAPGSTTTAAPPAGGTTAAPAAGGTT
jgi:type IV pilus assembly protein PilO